MKRNYVEDCSELPELPREVWMEILNRLSMREKQQCSWSGKLMRQLVIESIDEIEYDEGVGSIPIDDLSQFYNITSLNLYSEKIPVNFLSSFTRLKTLLLGHGVSLITTCPTPLPISLTSLGLDSKHIEEPSLANLHNLQKFAISVNHSFTGHCLVTLTQLRKLDIDQCHRFDYNILLDLPNLVSLSVSHIGDRHLSLLTGLIEALLWMSNHR